MVSIYTGSNANTITITNTITSDEVCIGYIYGIKYVNHGENSELVR